MDRPLRVMLMGGDASAWVEISASITRRSSQIFVPGDLTADDLKLMAGNVDIVMVVLDNLTGDPCETLRALAKAGLHKRTITIVEGDDRRTAAEVLATGISGYLLRSSCPHLLDPVIDQVMNGGVAFDAPAAAVTRSKIAGAAPAEQTHLGAARALASALELKDSYTGGHAERVTAMAVKLARAADDPEAKPSEALEAGFLLHDVGKIGIPESILTKPGPLTENERRVLNTHPILGERIIAPLGLPEVVRRVVRHHHERWDGRGYPDGLGGKDIPVAARIFAIADVIDAMTSIRPYRKPISFRDAVTEVLVNAGSQFDPQLAALAEQVFLDEPLQLLEIEG